jgi:signal peptidase I
MHGRYFTLGSEPKRGDVVVFKFPQDNSTDFIKRVIGLPGDRVQMVHDVLYLNGKPVPRERSPIMSATWMARRGTGPSIARPCRAAKAM